MPFQKPDHPKPTRAKMFVDSVSLRTWGVDVELRVVSRGEDNKAWATSTPQGSMKLTIKNEVASDQFWPGQEWYVDLTPIPEGKREIAGMEHDVDHGA